MTYIVATSTGFPSQYYPQEVLATALHKYCLEMELDFDLEQIDQFFSNVMIEGRYFALPLESVYHLPTWETTVNTAIEAAVNLATATVYSLLERVGLVPEEVSQITSATLIPAVPSIDARLMNRIPFSPNVKRIPISGIGCLGGAAGIARVADYLQGHPKEAAIVFCVELTSMLWQGSFQKELSSLISRVQSDPSIYSDIIMTLVTAALFGDGAGAVLMVGRDHPLAQKSTLKVIDNRSNWLPNTEDLVRVDTIDSGMRSILKPQLADFVKVGLRQVIDSLLADHNLSADKISRWIVHPGGPKIIKAIEDEFALGDQVLQLSRDTLARVGNIASATVLYMLNEVLSRDSPPPGSYGLLVAMGPGCSQEVVLLQW